MTEPNRPWLLDLSTEQRRVVSPAVQYDDEQQLTLQEPHIRAIDTGSAPLTKKADIEVGEDQKASW